MNRGIFSKIKKPTIKSTFKSKSKKYSWSVAFSLLIIISFSLFWNLLSINTTTKELAKTKARANFNKDTAIRFWASKHGGVYVPMDERTPANPHLSHIPNRNITMPNGDTLTLMNPAYMIRQMFDEFPKEYGVLGRIVSLKPLNLNNTPDDWEREALLSFENGEKERFEFTKINGEDYLRLMQPFVTKNKCLRCHAFQGYKVGDIRGGMGLSIPMLHLQQSAKIKRESLIFFHLLILFLGFIGIWFASKKLTKKEEALRESNVKFKTLFDSSLQPTFLSEKGVCTGQNYAAEKRFGYTTEEAIGKNAIDWIAEESKELVIKNIMSNFSIRYEAIAQHKNGRKFPAEIQGKAIELDGKSIRITTLNDISDRKKAELELKNSEERLQIMFDFAPDAYYLSDLKGNFIDGNRAAEKLIGYKKEELIGKSFLSLNLLKLKESPKAAKSLAQNLLGKSTDPEEFTLNRKEGGVAQVEIRTHPVKMDNKTVILGIARDITERKKTEEIMKNANAQFSSIMNSLDAVVYVADMETYEILFVNTSTQNMVGDVKGKICWQTIQKDQSGPCKFCTNNKLLTETGEPGETFTWEFQNTIAGKWHLIKDKAIRWHDGRIVRLEIATDITEKKLAQEEIAEYVEDLQMAHDTMEQTAGELVQLNTKLEESKKGLLESNANKDKFFSIISHDLKSPFGSILGITEILISDYDELSSDEIKEMVQILRNSSVNVYKLLEGLLEWARTQTDRMEYEFKSIDFYETSINVAALLKSSAQNKNIFLNNGVKENSIVYADEKAIETVLRNLIANAIKFTQPDGTIKIESENKEDEVTISVSDNGIGMSEDDKNKLFKIEVHHTTVGTNNEAGTGVGLILCKELVKKHGGKIWVESELGKGSKFVFTISNRK